MTAYIKNGTFTKSLAVLMAEEIATNATDVCNYGDMDWSPEDKRKIHPILIAETAIIEDTATLSKKTDSVKGEEAMQAVYATSEQKKATDAIVLKDVGTLSLIEAKYLIKFASKGPFGGLGSFKARISQKFDTMAELMAKDGETLEPLRIIVVSEEQLPYSINHVRALVEGAEPSETFSNDGKKHQYVLCSSSSLRIMVDDPPIGIHNAQKYLFFKI